MDPLLDFSNDVALITGAGSGFGKLLAVSLAERGAKLVLTDINEDALTTTCAEVNNVGGEVASLVGNIADEKLAEQLVNTATERFGKLTIAVNNAGIAHQPGPLHMIDSDTLNSQFDVNVNGVFFGMKYQVIAMLANGSGHILNVSSMAGIGGAPKGAAYAAAKHAVAGLTRTAAVEYGRKNVRVNAICPFYSPTNILNIDGYNTDEARAQLAQGCPMKRLGDPQEIVNTMLLMLSPGNSYMNGQCIAVDGGVSAW
ncbi:SDR family NAD(P)-dependent oxidoreductase [Aestuariibacter salexigens]|uniref:SDR family NAD(P)-dependent oxidoreductase n=1 Tax=Aestuariibacter salexigens TaxID=226010 RepID=UPI0003F88DCE|nr:glucose 1-dehydrogenase [Aestuariibacter salexigens]